MKKYIIHLIENYFYLIIIGLVSLIVGYIITKIIMIRSRKNKKVKIPDSKFEGVFHGFHDC